jgi:hypothetical protein
MTEIGSSAFQLQTVAEQRKDIINGTTLIRRMDDEMDDEDEAAIKEGKMPVYPRGMLKFELGVGDGTIIDAIEFKRLPGIILGETSLGAKLKLRNVRVLRGIREYLITFIVPLGDGLMEQSCLNRRLSNSWDIKLTTWKLNNLQDFWRA